jgi:DNA-binding NtrC family response regulator
MRQKRSAKRIVIVEDQKATAWALAESLREDGYEAITAGSSEEALELGVENCDVLITDLRLPGMNGIELMTKVNEERRLPSILITAYGSSEVIARAKRAGAVRCFSKPFNIKEIKECLKKALRGRSRGRSKGRSGRNTSARRAGGGSRGLVKTNEGV